MRPAVPVYCRATPAECAPLFEKTGLVHNQHTLVAARHVVTSTPLMQRTIDGDAALEAQL
jgi:hypothetical protein